MNWNVCRSYDAKEEMPGGIYWQLLNLSKEEFDRGIQIYSFAETIKSIENEDLKQKLKDKLIEVYGYSSYYEIHIAMTRKIYSEEEIKAYVEKAITVTKSNYKKFPSGKTIPVDYKIVDVIQNVNNLEWKKEKIKEVLAFINEISYMYPKKVVGEKITQIILKIKDETIKKELVSLYSDKIWPEFKYYDALKNDEFYVLKKAEKYKDIRLGLNPDLKIGLEIEVNNNLFKNPWIYEQKGFKGYWCAVDLTVTDGNEFVTDIFHDTPDEFSKVCALLETIKELGYKYDNEKKNASGQINIGLNYLDTTDAILNFFEIFGNCEELLFYISNEEGQIPRKNIYENKYSKPFSGSLGSLEIEEDMTRDDVIRLFTAKEDYITLELLDDIEEAYSLGPKGMEVQKQKITSIPALEFKKNTVCLRSGNRLEIRIPNTSVEYEVWRDNIRLYGRIVEVSKEIADTFNKSDLTEKEIRKIELKEELKNETKTIEEKLFILMELLFEDDEIKKIYMDRFYCIQRKIKEEQITEYSRPQRDDLKGFGVVDFQRVYRTRVYENLGPVVIYDTKEKKVAREI